MKTGFLRAIAWAIAAAGAVDPVFTISRPVKPEVALVADERLPDPGLVDRVEAALESQFTIVRGPSFGAAAVVSVGYQLRRGVTAGAERGFAVVPEPRSPFVAIASASTPAHALLQARTPIDVRVRTVAARGKTLTVTLRRDGVAVDQATLTIHGDDTVEPVRLESAGAAPGTITLDVDARIDGPTAIARPTANVKLTQNIQDERWAVLSFDRRPSWMATFVRRALETDPRFVVTSRVATSRGAPAVTAGDPPAALSTLPSLELFQVVIVGAPEELTGDDEAGLKRFMEERGGSVVLLLDQPSPAAHSAAFRSLTGVPKWVLREKAEPWGTPSASAVLAPPELPDWAEAEDPSNVKPGETSPVWRTPVGRGSLVVSGALDAWRYRDANDQVFAAYWRGVVSRAGEAASTRDVATGPAPTFEPDERKLIEAWSQSRGGQVVPESALATLAPALAEALSPVAERRPYRPMQSALWIVPFGAALGFEWWLRRRNGLR